MKVKLTDGRIFTVDYEWESGEVGRVPNVEVIYTDDGEHELYVSPRQDSLRASRGASSPGSQAIDDTTLWEIERIIIEEFDPSDYYSDPDDR